MKMAATKILNILELPLARLEEDPNNPNYMAPEQLEALANVMRETGCLQPPLVRKLEKDRYRIIDGHHRAAAAQKAGLSSIPCVVVETDEEAAIILQLGMNKIRGELNLGEVAKIIADLDARGWTKPELALTGFSAEELDDLLKAATAPTDEEVLEGASLGLSNDAAPPAEEPGGPFELVIPFATKDELQRAKKGLRRAAGKGRELGEGLLTLLDTQE